VNEKINEIRNHIKAIVKTPTKTDEGRFIINANAAIVIKKCIRDLDSLIKSYDDYIHENLFAISEKIFIPATTVFGISTGNYIVDNYYLGVLDTIADFIDSELFQSKFKLKKPKIFISHSEKDFAYVSKFVELLEKIGVKQKHLFCSSVAGYQIPMSDNDEDDIYKYLREQFQDHELFVIYILSKDYYKSPVCLNEMGTAWVLKTAYQSILLPNTDFSKVKGVVNPRKISFKLDDVEQRQYRLTELRDTIISKLLLPMSDHTIWERQRNEFLDAIDRVPNKSI